MLLNGIIGAKFISKLIMGIKSVTSYKKTKPTEVSFEKLTKQN
jgi:hypothetical protein